jgi:hypothetical protein
MRRSRPYPSAEFDVENNAWGDRPAVKRPPKAVYRSELDGGPDVKKKETYRVNSPAFARFRHLSVLVGLGCLLTVAYAQTDPLPSWSDGPAKQAIINFVRVTTDTSSPHFVPPEERVATFDQDGTTWVEHPMYTQVMYCLDRVPAVVAKKPELKNVEAFKTVLSGDHAAIAKLPATVRTASQS